MNQKQKDALDTIINFALYFTSDENSRERLIEAAYEYVEQDHVLSFEDSISIEWCIDDVQSVRPDLDNEQAMQVLHAVKDDHDATIGVTWDTLEYAADHMFPETETESEEDAA
jgi:hypothetical protein